MPVPDYQQFMLPLLELLQTGNEYAINTYVEQMAARFNLTDSDRRELLPSGGTVLRNRVGWASTYLVKAGLIKRTGRGRIMITPLGLQVVSSKPRTIDQNFLMQFSGFAEFVKKSSTEVSKGSGGQSSENLQNTILQLPPDESLEFSYRQLRESLAQDLLERVKSAPPAFFEQLVVDLMLAMGYGGSRSDAGHAIGGSGDGGIDGIIKEDRLGLDSIYLQAKRWEGSVSRPTIQAFAGSLEGQRARKGVVITTSTFTKEARDYVQRIEKRIVLIDGEQLVQYMMDFGIGVTEVASYQVLRPDLDYFGDE